MNSIEFEVVNFKDDKYSDGVVAINIVLDGKKVKSFLDVSAIIAHAKIEEQTPDIIRNHPKDGAKQFFAFTCSCGVPGCAGFFDPVIQQLESINSVDFVKWSVAPNKSTSIAGDYLFPAQKYYAAIDELKTKLINLEQDGYFYEGFFEEYNKNRYTDLIQSIDSICSEYNDSMLFSQLVANYINPEYAGRQIALKLNNEVQPLHLSLYDFLTPILFHLIKESDSDGLLVLIEQLKYANVVLSALEANNMDLVWDFIFEGYFYGGYAEPEVNSLKKEYAMAFAVYLKDEDDREVSLALV